MPRRVDFIRWLLAVLLITTGVAIPAASAAGETVLVWMTTGDQSKLLAQQSSISFGPDTSNGLLLHINEQHSYQQIDGFGAALTDSAAWLIANRLTSAERETLMRNLFSPSEGIGLSYIRLPMGASDFALSHYTYNDMPPGQSDPNLTNFSIDHDRAYLIPLLKQALTLNPNLKIMASPWSAPAWMKDNDSLYKGTLRTEYYGSYANYFVKFIQSYAAEGIAITAVTVQNEPQHRPDDYPGMWLTPRDEINFVKDHLGPAFAANNISTRIITLDHNWSMAYWGNNVLEDPAAAAYIDGTAFHCYGGNAGYQSITRNSFPQHNIYFTECSSGLWATNFANNLAWDLQNLIVGGARNWARAVIKWNLALDTESGPHTGGCSNCTGVVTIDQNSATVSAYNHDYYALGHASKFVMPGARRIASSDLGANKLENVAFKNPDGSKVLIVLNNASRGQTFKVRWGGQSFQYNLPAKAVATFKWSGTQGVPEAPEAPGAPAAEAGDGRVRLSWDFSYLATSYNVKRATSSGGPYTTISSGLSLPEYVDTTVSNGTTYYYVVSAVNARGESGNSASASATPNPPATVSAASQIEAESFNASYGIAIEATSDTGGGENIGSTEEGDYLLWQKVDFASGLKKVQARVASDSTGGTIEFRLGSPDGSLIASLDVGNTGGWQRWTTISGSIAPVSGVQTLYVVFRGMPPKDGITNLNWIKFTTR